MNPETAPALPRDTDERCAARAELRGDPLIGTAFPAARLLLVEQPGSWGRAGLADSGFDGAVARALEARAAGSGVRVQAIRRSGRVDPPAERCWIMADTRDGHETLLGGTFTDDRELADLPLDASVGDPLAGPLYLVCTHGKRDVCCALRGRPIAAALDQARPGQVWETSHLGGDRFGANVLVLPSGLVYGRVLPFAVPELAAAADADLVVTPLLRGRIGTTPAAQAALQFGHVRLGLPRRSDLRVEASPRPVDGRATIRLDTPGGSVDVTVAVERVETSGLTCANPGPGWFLRYRALDLTPVSD